MTECFDEYQPPKYLEEIKQFKRLITNYHNRMIESIDLLLESQQSQEPMQFVQMNDEQSVKRQIGKEEINLEKTNEKIIATKRFTESYENYLFSANELFQRIIQ